MRFLLGSGCNFEVNGPMEVLPLPKGLILIQQGFLFLRVGLEVKFPNFQVHA